MIIRKGLGCIAVAAMALSSAAFADTVSPRAGVMNSGTPILADETAGSGDTDTTSSQPATPLMYGLSQSPAGQWMTDQNLNITGYVEGGYMHDFDTPGNISGKRTFGGDRIAYGGAYKDEVILDQLDLSVSKTIDLTKEDFDIGFMLEANYGRDSFFNHSNGLLDENNKHGNGANDQLDLEQAYVTVGIPVAGSDLVLQVGKFVTLDGYETINPTTNQFYTHSYIFTYGIPLTQTGITAKYGFSPEVTAEVGVTRGWNQSLEDNNSTIDGIWQVAYVSDDKTLTVNFNGSVGPEGAPGTLPYGPVDNGNVWFVPEVTATYKVADELTVGVDTLWGFANHYDQWYSVAGYAGYQLMPKYLTLNGRFEWYNDGAGLTTGVGRTTNYEEVTLGLQIRPFADDAIFQWLQFRPEIREDVADHGVFDGRNNQFTASVDAIMQF